MQYVLALARCVLISFKSTTVNFMIKSCNECHHETGYFRLFMLCILFTDIYLHHQVDGLELLWGCNELKFKELFI